MHPKLWSPDRWFEGQAVAIIGGGPQLKSLDLDLLRGHRFIAVNSSSRVVQPVATAEDILYFTDNSWLATWGNAIDPWPGLVVTSNRNSKKLLGDRALWFDVTALTMQVGACADHVQASSGHIAACLAAVMGAVRIPLVAFECRTIDGRTHGHDDYGRQPEAAFADRFLPGWRGLAPAFARMGIEVVNATPNSAVDCFPSLSLAEALS